MSILLPPDWLVVAPRAPKPDPAGGFAWHPRAADEWPTLARFDDAVASVGRVIGALPDLYDADPRQVHLMGFSQGAATAYATAMGRPGLVRSIAGLVGFVPDESDDVARTAPLDGLPVYRKRADGEW